MRNLFKASSPFATNLAPDTPTVRRQPGKVNAKVSPVTLQVASIFRLTRSGSQTKVIQAMERMGG